MRLEFEIFNKDLDALSEINKNFIIHDFRWNNKDDFSFEVDYFTTDDLETYQSICMININGHDGFDFYEQRFDNLIEKILKENNISY